MSHDHGKAAIESIKQIKHKVNSKSLLAGNKRDKLSGPNLIKQFRKDKRKNKNKIKSDFEQRFD